jgi:putative endonuclease
MPYTYILFSKKLNKYYVGACTDIERRMYEHNIGIRNLQAQAFMGIVYKQHFETLILAKQFEAKIKKMKSRKYIIELVGSG